ncbi:MAG: DUF2079 domain-containing protein, partial [Thermoplasmata archaeon]|nr:DUF2079 domain-containing protein [Thermoplasmata archaeon]
SAWPLTVESAQVIARVYAPAGTYQAEYALAQTIPPGASVLVDSNAFPWVANNPQAYTIPIEEYPLLHPYIYSINQTVHEDAQYVLLNIEDVGVFPYFDNFSAYMQANYGVLAESDGNLLLEWHYQGPMTWDGGYTSAYPTDDFVAKPASSGFNWAGPWASLMPGEYDVDIQFIPNASGEHAFEVTAEGGQVVLLRTNATVTAPQVGIVQTLTIPLNVSWIHDGVEFLSVATPMFSAAIQSATLVENSPPPGST